MFSDCTRIKILTALCLSEMCVNDLSVLLKLNQTTVSHQLKFLKQNGAVKCKRDGKIIYYSIADNCINDVMLNGVNYLLAI
jgi:DNA-binding transcriptional ArsR family regulator